MKPRVFISSTFYDLKQIRAALEQMIRDIGYESVRHKTGDIPYSKKDALETPAYREVELCDIMVSVIGGRFGTESKDTPGSSISQKELKRALDRGVQVFIFVDRNVLAEYRTYLANKGVAGITFQAVDDPRVYQFLEQIYALPNNNPITGFETSSDVVTFLKAQWAGLFQQFLREQERTVEVDLVKEMSKTAQTLRDLVDFLSKDNKGKDETIRTILLINHPAFHRFAELTDTKYRVFFTNYKEFQAWMKANSWTKIKPDGYDSDSVDEWTPRASDDFRYMNFRKQLFDDSGSLKTISEAEWNDHWITIEAFAQPESAKETTSAVPLDPPRLRRK